MRYLIAFLIFISRTIVSIAISKVFQVNSLWSILYSLPLGMFSGWAAVTYLINHE